MNIKRIFDIAVAGPGIVITAVPVLGIAFTMAAINHASPFFTQQRVGKDGKTFNILKIKTMNDAHDENGRLLPDDQRVSKIGILLRKSRLDELPQLINVLKGDMSLVGPRPAGTYVRVMATDEKRHKVQPGLTGPAQVFGKNVLSAEEILKLDHEYVDTHSFWGDLKLIAKTPLSLFQHRDQPHYRVDAQEYFHGNEI